MLLSKMIPCALLTMGLLGCGTQQIKCQFPEPSSSADGSPSAVVISDIAAQHAKEATICTGTETQVNGLQNWIKEQQALSR